MSSYVSCFIYHVAQLHGEDRKTHNRCLTITTCGFCITGLRSGPGFVKHGGRQCTERRVLNAWEHLRGRTIPVNRPTADGEALRNKEEGMRRRTTDRNTQAHATRKKESLSSLARPITWEDARVLREGRDTHANKDTHTKNTHTHTQKVCLNTRWDPGALCGLLGGHFPFFTTRVRAWGILSDNKREKSWMVNYSIQGGSTLTEAPQEHFERPLTGWTLPEQNIVIALEEK